VNLSSGQGRASRTGNRLAAGLDERPAAGFVCTFGNTLTPRSAPLCDAGQLTRKRLAVSLVSFTHCIECPMSGVISQMTAIRILFGMSAFTVMSAANGQLNDGDSIVFLGDSITS